MIVPMQKVAIVLPESRRAEAVRAIGELRIVDLGQLRNAPANQALARAEKALHILSEFRAHSEPPALDIQALIHQTLATADQRQAADTRREELRLEAARIAPLGSFDPASLAPLIAAGIDLRLSTRLQRRKTIHVVHIGPEIPGGHSPFPMPTCSLVQIQEQIATADAEFAAANAALAEFASARPQLLAEIATLRDLQSCEHVVAAMGIFAPFATLGGYCPEPQVAAVRSAVEALGGALLAIAPAATDEPPTLLKNAKFAESAAPVFQLIDTVPGYRETDVSFWFLLYLTLFIAILVGDAGYGLLLLGAAASWHAWRGLPRPTLRLCAIAGTLTMVWGAMSGNWFGSQALAEQPILASFVIADLDVFNSASQRQVMYLCFVLGASHLTVAHVIAAWRKRSAMTTLGHAGWLLLLAGAFFLVRFLVLDLPMPRFAVPSMVVGTVLSICCGQPRTSIIATLIAGLGNFPLKAIACFSDIISYIRLFAVGMATFAVAASFNDIAGAMRESGPLLAIVGLIVLLLGHTVNILMAGLAVVVHGVRLNMLEFSGHAEMQWTGEPYRPFRLSRTDTHPGDT